MLRAVMSFAIVMSTACLDPAGEPAPPPTEEVGSAEFASELARKDAVGTVPPCVVCERGAVWSVYYQTDPIQYTQVCGMGSRPTCSSGPQGPTGWTCSDRPTNSGDPNRAADGNIYVGYGWACLAR